MQIEDWHSEADQQIIRREKQKARELRQSQLWKNRRACNICYYCKTDTPARKLTMDHVVPLARGGRSTKSNLVPCCKSCNNLKKKFTPFRVGKIIK